MFAEAQLFAQSETGGMLLGYRTEETGEQGEQGEQIVITDLIGAGPAAVHRRDGFIPDGAWQQERLGEKYVASGRVTTYLGDWHSHPDSSPLPSKKDRKTAKKISRHREARAQQPLMLIVGRDEDRWRLMGYRYVGGSFHPLVLKLFGLGSHNGN